MTTVTAKTSSVCRPLLWLPLILLGLTVPFVYGNPSSRELQIQNQSGSKVLIYWINRWENDALVLNTEDGLLYGADSEINSFQGHEFEVQEVPHKTTQRCKGENGICRKVIFQVNSNYGQVVLIDKKFTLTHRDNTVVAGEQATEILHQCKAASADDMDPASPQGSIDRLAECVQGGLQNSLATSHEEITFQERIRTRLADNFDTYACADLKLNTSESIRNETFTYRQGDTGTIQVKVLHESPTSQIHESPTSQIHYMPNFVTAEECSALKEQKLLQGGSNGPAKVQGVNGLYGSIITVAVKDHAVLLSLAGKINAYADDNMATDNDTRLARVKEIVSMDYKGRRETNTGNADKSSLIPTSFVPDQHMAHCDYGECGSSGAISTEDADDRVAADSSSSNNNRVASLIMFCEIAEKGGAVSFHNTAIHVKPETNSAIFVSYVDLKTQMTDNGFTKYSGCPVLEGEKKTATAYLQRTDP